MFHVFPLNLTNYSPNERDYPMFKDLIADCGRSIMQASRTSLSQKQYFSTIAANVFGLQDEQHNPADERSLSDRRVA